MRRGAMIAGPVLLATVPTAARGVDDPRHSGEELRRCGRGGVVGWAAAVTTALSVGGSADGRCVPGELNGDGVVDAIDLAILLQAWGAKGGPADLDGSGRVDGADLAVLLGNWGSSCQLPWASIVEHAPDPAVVTDADLRAAIVATGLPWRVLDHASQIEMLLVPPGTFMMGCSPSTLWLCDGAEEPVHPVTLTQPFYLGRTEVTQAEWTAVMGSNPSGFAGHANSALRPVDSVSWNMVQQFAAATGLRLPTEAEWEYACRAGTTTAFNDGSDSDWDLVALAWFMANSRGETHPVGLKAPNALGFHDMHGNVLEWVSDWYSETWYAQSPAIDPAGPSTGSSRVMRGGNWHDDSNYARSSRRSYGPPNSPSIGVGFRAARTP